MNPSFYPHTYYPHSPPSLSHAPNTITVHGQGTVKAIPDTISMTIGVMTENLNVQEALKENSAKSTQLIQALNQMGIRDEQIETASFTINPKYDYSDGKATLIGYEVQHLFTLTVKDVKQAGEVYKTAVDSGANIARNLQFQLQNADLYYQEALKLAVQNAKEKAYTIARSLKATLHEPPVEIIEETLYPVYESAVSPKATVLAAQSVPPIQPGEQRLQAQLKVVFSYG
ncbi:SIMPL domain-containing protein [Bacillus songklensis]|uniref:SIMPL domain-containing protein n=1 Tax=Bacillus songklensis TaxID=1069116 RepID=A0ABV8B4W2_9BACI